MLKLLFSLDSRRLDVSSACVIVWIIALPNLMKSWTYGGELFSTQSVTTLATASLNRPKVFSAMRVPTQGLARDCRVSISVRPGFAKNWIVSARTQQILWPRSPVSVVQDTTVVSPPVHCLTTLVKSKWSMQSYGPVGFRSRSYILTVWLAHAPGLTNMPSLQPLVTTHGDPARCPTPYNV